MFCVNFSDTVFGPDAVDSKEAWFKHAKPEKGTPTDQWGILPRLAHELFEVRSKARHPFAEHFFQQIERAAFAFAQLRPGASFFAQRSLHFFFNDTRTRRRTTGRSR